MTKTLLLFLTTALAAPAFAQADETIIVTGVRDADGADPALDGSSVTTLDADALETRQTRIVADVLRDVPGVAVSRSGPIGGATAVRIRGGEGNHTLVLIDGIEASDPFQSEFDFATLIADDQARIEVLRGQASSIYGSDAIGGVVHYITPTGREAPGLSGRIEGGTFGSYAGTARAGGVVGPLDYALSGGAHETNGTPSARAGIGDRRLAASSQAVSAKLGLAVAPNLRLSAVGRYGRTSAETNPQDFDVTSPTVGLVIDGEDDYRSRVLLGLVRAELELLEGRWTHAASAQINNTHRENRTEEAVTFATSGQRLKGAYDTTFRIEAGEVRHAFTVAVDFERETFRNVALFEAGPANDERETDNTGLVGEYRLTLGEVAGLAASMRHDWNDRFRDAATYRISGAYRVLPQLRLRAAAGSGIKNPTNFELFGFDPGSFIGNPDLRPETSEGSEAGADLDFAGGRAAIGATYFRSVLRDEIFTVFTPTFEASPENRTTRSRQQGVELIASARPVDPLRLTLAYTYLDAEENGVEELRRAPHIGSANVEWREDAWGANINVRVNGKQRDTDFRDFSTTELDGFVLVNLSADVALADGVELFGRVENLLGEEYEEVFAYRGAGRSAAAGVRARF